MHVVKIVLGVLGKAFTRGNAVHNVQEVQNDSEGKKLQVMDLHFKQEGIGT